MTDYIDGFVLRIRRVHLDEYRQVAERVAEIWKEHGALSYFEYVSDDLSLEGVRSFSEVVEAKECEVIIFGWVVFPSKEIRDQANVQVPKDPRMADLVAPLIDPSRLIFNASRMVYGGFQPLVQSK
ncbi:hypothetical protein BFP97_03370 [Roseivirga sp. 4D4]|uniref:DUF1428 domain-containing protein n=1 Tax=Roseivirga sp. 4D4 TaxID=1889784 RepID=UPI0008529469|nr:DUF1428 domain-containing protein [Roseivirga sp. 4D4]OEK03733.1 hypothetical protein BFP97_03370 [Roseivirga sp. 4D4]